MLIYCGIISELDDAVRAVLCSAVVSQESEEEWAKYPSLQGAGVYCDNPGGGVADAH